MERSLESNKYKLKGWRRRRVLGFVSLLGAILLFAAVVEKWEAASALGLDHLEEKKPSQLSEDARTKIFRDVDQSRRQSDEYMATSFILSDFDEEYPIGFARVPRIPPGERTGDDGKLHILFSSGCNMFQHWQSELLLASAKMVNQRGRITRIVSGCHDRKAETVKHRHQTFPPGINDKLVSMKNLNRSLNDDFGLFISPSFNGARDFPWINKPSSIRYFMEHARDEIDKQGETVVAILDPDFVFMKPLTQINLDERNVITTRHQEREPGRNMQHIDWVMKGRPVAQRYGLEGQWVEKFKGEIAEMIGDPETPAQNWDRKQARTFTSVGPPMLVHVDDLMVLSKWWSKLMRPVLKRDKDILADMWAYSIASAHLGLLHTTLDHFMISASGTEGQAYPFVDSFEHLSCRNPTIPPGNNVPVFIHMASNFKAPDRKLGPWMFHKGHVPPRILDCDVPLLVEAPDDLWEISDDRKTKQHAWVLCNIVAKLNHVALEYKKKFCPNGFEARKLVRLIQRKKLDVKCNELHDPWCFPLAQIEGLPASWRERSHNFVLFPPPPI